MLPSDVELDDEPLEWRPKTTSFPQISDEMVASIALGMEDELVVASRHNMSVEQFYELSKQPWFQAQVATKRADFEKSGVTFRAKAAWMASDLLDQVYIQAADNNASLAQKHEVLKTLIKAGGLEPKDEKEKPTGPTFAISIDLGGGQTISLSNNGTHPRPAIDVETKEIE
jgi:hypothetical protein